MSSSSEESLAGSARVVVRRGGEGTSTTPGIRTGAFLGAGGSTGVGVVDLFAGRRGAGGGTNAGEEERSGIKDGEEERSGIVSKDVEVEGLGRDGLSVVEPPAEVLVVPEVVRLAGLEADGGFGTGGSSGAIGAGGSSSISSPLSVVGTCLARSFSFSFPFDLALVLGPPFFAVPSPSLSFALVPGTFRLDVETEPAGFALDLDFVPLSSHARTSSG